MIRFWEKNWSGQELSTTSLCLYPIIIFPHILISCAFYLLLCNSLPRMAIGWTLLYKKKIQRYLGVIIEILAILRHYFILFYYYYFIWSSSHWSYLKNWGSKNKWNNIWLYSTKLVEAFLRLVIWPLEIKPRNRWFYNAFKIQARGEANHLALEIFQKRLDSWKIYVENRVQLNNFFWVGWIQILVSITILKTIVYRDNNWKMFQRVSYQGMHESMSCKIYKESQIYKKTGFSQCFEIIFNQVGRNIYSNQFIVHYTKKFKPQKKDRILNDTLKTSMECSKGKEITTILEKVTYQPH